MKKQKIKKIYFVENSEDLADDEMNNLLMCSTKNWNYYFSELSQKAKKIADFSEINDVNLLEFSSSEEMLSYVDRKNPRIIIDWSLEHGKPMVLEFAKI